MTTVAITGGAGFIGHHVVEHILKTTDWSVVVLDKLTYASHGLDRLRDIKAFEGASYSGRLRVFTADLACGFEVGLRREIGPVDYILHLAAETHVDNSIADPMRFVEANVLGTARVLEWARTAEGLKRLVYFSTDEVFGPAPDGVSYKEWDRYNSTNPYSATKAAGEELVLAWANTFKVPALITHTMNVFGERQHAEKFIPMCIRRILAGKEILVHADPTCTRSGSRFYIHARNVAAAILFLLERGEVREKYNIVGEREVSNENMVRFVADVLNKTPTYRLVDFHSSRPGHDLRYALDGARMHAMGWSVPVDFIESLARTVRWSVDPANSRWLGAEPAGSMLTT